MTLEAPRRWPILLAALVILLAGLAVYSNSFRGGFLFDDIIHIVTNSHIRHLRPFWDMTTPAEGGSRRPLVSLTLAANYALGKLDVRGYHALNAAVHILAALALFGIVRRTLLSPRLRERFGTASTAAAATVAIAWVIHPLQTESVTYIVQRAESMAGLFYLLTLYCFIRATGGSRHPRPWLAASVVACALGMFTKEVMATAPLMVLLYDRVFISSSFSEVFRRRWGLYAALFASCLILVGLALSLPPSSTVGFDLPGITPAGYALTQARIIVTHYLRLVFWPRPLILDYNLPCVQSAVEAGLPALATILLIAGTVVAFRFKQELGFLGAWFFVTLAPTSSFIPVGDMVFEHRMYLALAGVLALVILPLWRIRKIALRGVALAGLGACFVVLGMLTYQRNADYRSEIAMWSDNVEKLPLNRRPYNNLAASYLRAGEPQKAIPPAQEALRLDPLFADARFTLIAALAATGRNDEAFAQWREADKIPPNTPAEEGQRLDALFVVARYDVAATRCRDILKTRPADMAVRLRLADALARLRRFTEAQTEYETLVKADPQNATAQMGLIATLAQQGRFDKASGLCAGALEVHPQDPRLHELFAMVLTQQGRTADAIDQYRAALRLDPNRRLSLNNMARILATNVEERFRNGSEAVALATRASQLAGGSDITHLDTLAAAYAEAGRFGEAAETVRKALALAKSAGRSDYAAVLQNRIRLYEQGKPLRERMPGGN